MVFRNSRDFKDHPGQTCTFVQVLFFPGILQIRAVFRGLFVVAWREAERFRVRDEAGAQHVVVKLSRSLDDEAEPSSRQSARETSFYFLLDGSDVAAMPNGDFVHQKSGDILKRQPIEE